MAPTVISSWLLTWSMLPPICLEYEFHEDSQFLHVAPLSQASSDVCWNITKVEKSNIYILTGFIYLVLLDP